MGKNPPARELVELGREPIRLPTPGHYLERTAQVDPT
jgi:hypothetical protein